MPKPMLITDSETRTENKTQGSSTSHSISKESVAGKTIKGVASAASLLGAALAPVTGGVSLAVGGVVSGGLGMLGSAISKNVSDSISSNEPLARAFLLSKVSVTERLIPSIMVFQRLKGTRKVFPRA